MKGAQKRKFSIRFTVGTMFIVAIILTATFSISLQYYFSKNTAVEQALTELTMISEEASSYMGALDANAVRSVNLLSHFYQTKNNQLSDEEQMKIFAQALIDTPHFYSLYVGHDNEDFFQIINLDSSPIVRQRIEADSQDRWVVIKISEGPNQRNRETLYYSKDFELNRRTQEVSNYYPTQRPWFRSSQGNTISKTSPYLFQHLKITGQTYSMRVPNSNLVLGLDIVLSSLSAHITHSHPAFANNNGAELYIFSANGDIISTNAAEQADDGILTSVEPLKLTEKQQAIVDGSRSLKVSNQNDSEPIDFAAAGEPRGYAVDLLYLVAKMTGLKFEFINGFSRGALVDKFNQGSLDILHSVQVASEQGAFGLFSQPMYSLPFATVSSKTLGSGNSSDNTIGVVEGWTLFGKLQQEYPHYLWRQYPSSADLLEAVSKGEVKTALGVQAVLQQTMKYGNYNSLQLSTSDKILESIPDSFHLMMRGADLEIMKIINLALNNISEAQRLQLADKWLREQGATSHNYMKVPYPEVVQLAGEATSYHQMLQRRIGQQSNYLFITDIKAELDGKEFFAVLIPTQVLTAQVTEKVLKSLIMSILIMAAVLPMVWIFVTPIVNPIRQLREEISKIKMRDFDQVEVVATRIKEVDELSYAFSDMAKEIKQREENQEEFIESFIQLIAQAIDDKSAYTAGHCNRVPEIGLMLADVAERSDKPAFKHFKFANEDERREFKIAAWLHDCGKIVIPEDIVDKGTKLECIYNRIHEIRMRFEVLWRDAEIHYLTAMQEGGDKQKCLAKLLSRQQELQQQFLFIAKANVGGEFISDKDVQRLNQIGQQEWTRYFDDRLGLSPIEEAKLDDIKPTVPAKERLLADKPSHIEQRSRDVNFDPTFGIQIDVPKYHANRGELYNLSIGRGTLTQEDRYRINEHSISTIKMLENLPFPPELSRVPRYASTHHETMKGTGYPRRLTREELSIPERILAVADIFEALTADDRPYKKAKPLSVAIDIMHKMALDEHIDMDLFLLFLESGTYLRYAEKYLPHSQRDEVDISQYLTKKEPVKEPEITTQPIVQPVAV